MNGFSEKSDLFLMSRVTCFESLSSRQYSLTGFIAEDTNAQDKRVTLFYQVVEYTAYVAFGEKN